MLRKIYLLFVQFGIDPRAMLASLRGLPRYVSDLYRFRSSYSGRLELFPCLRDWYEEGGSTRDEYFWQDLLVARMIFQANPDKHVDIGSSVNGFIAHVASFRDIEMFDVRPITTQIPGVKFIQADMMNPRKGFNGYCDSLSCLHALEHFGLGRYGDPIDPRGFEHGLSNMSLLLKENGIFYLSVPIGIARVEFNAHHVFDPRIIINLAKVNSLQPVNLLVIRQGYKVEELAIDDDQLQELASQRYALGIFTFAKCSKVQ